MAERLFVQSLLRWLGYDLITALGGTKNTLYVGVSFIPELATLGGKGFSEFAQLQWPVLAAVGHCRRLDLPAFETFLFPSGVPFTASYPAPLTCFQHVALPVIARSGLAGRPFSLGVNWCCPGFTFYSP